MTEFPNRIVQDVIDLQRSKTAKNEQVDHVDQPQSLISWRAVWLPGSLYYTDTIQTYLICIHLS